MHTKNLLLILIFITALLAGCRPVTRAGSDLAVFEGPFAAVEREVGYDNQGQRIAATLTLPEGSAATASYPVVLILHGFTNHRDSLPITRSAENLYGRTARLLAQHGIAALRIDFRGSGESEGQWSDTTFSGQISDALAAIDFLAELPEIDSTRLGLIGLSQGGLVAAETAARSPEVDSVILWSVVSNPPDTYQLLMGAETVAKGLSAPAEGVEVRLPWGDPFLMKSGFFEDLYAVNPIGAISRVHAPLLVVVGLRDTTVMPQPYQGETYLNYHEGPEQLLELDTDHVLGVLTDAGSSQLDKAIAASLAWLEHSLPVAPE